MNSQFLSPDFEDHVFEIIQSTSFKELLKSNRTEDKKLIAEYYEKIEVYYLAIEVQLSLGDYTSARRLLEKGESKIGKRFNYYLWICDSFYK